MHIHSIFPEVEVESSHLQTTVFKHFRPNNSISWNEMWKNLKYVQNIHKEFIILIMQNLEISTNN